ncbi:MAG: nucleotide exchange factor GrpE [Bacteroidales bacterium]|nr:nucleotide exchange factor GrpE [Bacteroidales bacterium]
MSKNKKENIEQEVEQPVVNEQQPEVEAENTQATEGAEEEVVVSKEEELAGKLAEANDKYVRLAAEFDNYRRRVAREKLDIIATASEDVIKGILPVLDDCGRALQVLEQSAQNDATKAAKEGTELIMNKLTAYLKTKGLEQIDAMGKEFDTDFHEAIAQFPVQEADKKNKVFDVTQHGYTLNGKVIRFAKVVVGI